MLLVLWNGTNKWHVRVPTPPTQIWLNLFWVAWQGSKVKAINPLPVIWYFAYNHTGLNSCFFLVHVGACMWAHLSIFDDRNDARYPWIISCPVNPASTLPVQAVILQFTVCSHPTVSLSHTQPPCSPRVPRQHHLITQITLQQHPWHAHLRKAWCKQLLIVMRLRVVLKVEARAEQRSVAAFSSQPPSSLPTKQGLLPALAQAVMSLFHVSCESARLCLAGTQTELRPINTKCNV